MYTVPIPRYHSIYRWDAFRGIPPILFIVQRKYAFILPDCKASEEQVQDHLDITNILAKGTGLRRVNKGFTLLELLIIIGILGILAAVIIPNVSTFFSTGHLAAANEELQTIHTAAMGYRGEHNLEWPVNSNQLDQYISKKITGYYEFNTTTGMISDASGWADLTFNKGDQKWEKAP